MLLKEFSSKDCFKKMYNENLVLSYTRKCVYVCACVYFSHIHWSGLCIYPIQRGIQIPIAVNVKKRKKAPRWNSERRWFLADGRIFVTKKKKKTVQEAPGVLCMWSSPDDCLRIVMIWAPKGGCGLVGLPLDDRRCCVCPGGRCYPTLSAPISNPIQRNTKEWSQQ